MSSGLSLPARGTASGCSVTTCCQCPSLTSLRSASCRRVCVVALWGLLAFVIRYFPRVQGRAEDSSEMNTTRIEASASVLAIIITIMVLELKVPHAVELAALKPVLPVFLSYVLSFIYVGIYWNNQHHLFQAAEQVSGGILWANLHLLFWLSLFPFTTAWMGENHLLRFERITAAYC